MRGASHQHTIRFQSLASNGPTAKHTARPARMSAATLFGRHTALCQLARETPWSDTVGYAIASARRELAYRYAVRALRG